MLTMLVVGVLLAVAYPSFTNQIRKGRRADAIAALTAIQQAQERWRANKPTYANFNTAADGAMANGLSAASSSSSGYYAITIDGLSGTTYTVVATANEGKSQAHDGNCRRIGLRAASGTLRYGSGAASIDWAADNPDLGNCWAR